MTIRQALRAAKHVASEFVPWQAVAVDRDYDAAVLAAADALADEEAEYELLEPPTGVDVAAPPAIPSVGLSDWAMHQLMQHARRWCDLPTLQPGPLPTPDGHPDNSP